MYKQLIDGIKMYNEISKDIEITGVEGSTLESQLIAIHSYYYK